MQTSRIVVGGFYMYVYVNTIIMLPRVVLEKTLVLYFNVVLAVSLA